MQKLLVFLLPLLFVNCFHTERNCADFKTGTFEFNYEIDGITKTGKFVRTETLNIDYFENKVDSASIRWINDCEFIQKTINPKNNNEEKAIHFKILTTSEDSYTFEYQLAAKDAYKKKRVKKGIAKKIK
ncbi:MAG: hypothetical protein ACJARX_000716 [Psychroserpens sp.]|jgi:hypothetical protein|uniref:hypothetical protein n=1 Tax=Psychroserpens sp. TaxID=2020870 RepID=UPI0039E36692